jgi:hypothetical protein
MDASAEKTLKQLEDMTEGLLRTLEQVDQIAQDFSRGDGGKQQRELFSKVESLASGLEELHEIPIDPELTVPFAVLDHIDKAESPDLYWKQVVETTLEVRPRAASRPASAPCPSFLSASVLPGLFAVERAAKQGAGRSAAGLEGCARRRAAGEHGPWRRSFRRRGGGDLRRMKWLLV